MPTLPANDAFFLYCIASLSRGAETSHLIPSVTWLIGLLKTDLLSIQHHWPVWRSMAHHVEYHRFDVIPDSGYIYQGDTE